MTISKLTQILDGLKIDYKIFEHEPCFTVEEAQHLLGKIEGAHTKNLFLKPKKKQEFHLVSLLEQKSLNIKEFAKSHNLKPLSFAADHYLEDILGVKPGSVTPYGLMNDTEHKTAYYIDQELLDADYVNFHPLVNHMTLQIKPDAFLTFLTEIGVEYKLIAV